VPQALARRAWTLFEPIHAIVYFASEANEQYAAAGLRGYWMGYFASRSAAMGAVGPEVVTAVFHNFRPSKVARALPDAWHFSSPERVLAARTAVADAALRRLWGDRVESNAMAEAAELALEVSANLCGDGRPLFSVHAGLPVPEDPHLKLWHACTLLREHRFDGHVATLTVSGLSGLDAIVIAHAAGTGMDPETMQQLRGWTLEERESAAGRLRDRGLLDEHDALTSAGRALRGSVEETTDHLANDAWNRVEMVRRERLCHLLRGFAVLLEAPDGMRYPNPIGVGRPA
jgi:hypothetical protein